MDIPVPDGIFLFGCDNPSILRVSGDLGLFIGTSVTVLSGNYRPETGINVRNTAILRLDLPESPKHCRKEQKVTESQESSRMFRILTTLPDYCGFLNIPAPLFSPKRTESDGNV